MIAGLVVTIVPVHNRPKLVVEAVECPQRLLGQPHDRHGLAQRARSQKLILAHACCAGLGPDLPEMQRLAPEVLPLARQSGTAGLGGELLRLFVLAREASGPLATGPDVASTVHWPRWRVGVWPAGWPARATG